MSCGLVSKFLNAATGHGDLNAACKAEKVAPTEAKAAPVKAQEQDGAAINRISDYAAGANTATRLAKLEAKM